MKQATVLSGGIDRIAASRLRNQWIARPAGKDPAHVAAWLGAVQAQDYAAAKWALALRSKNAVTDTDIERAFRKGTILRTHVLRPTWHFVAAADIHWMLQLTAPRVHRALTYGNRMLELPLALRNRAASIFERALGDGACLTRAELGDALARRGIEARRVRLALLSIYAELEGVMCSGPPRDGRQTYALLPARAPRARRLQGDEALAELSTRYFQSHGPATARDFGWWSGLTIADAKRGIEAAGARRVVVDGQQFWSMRDSVERRPNGDIHLLPIYDEYLVAYRDHVAVPRPAARWGMLPQAVVARGYNVGAWKAKRADGGVTVDAQLDRPLSARETRALKAAAKRYGAFLQLKPQVTV